MNCNPNKNGSLRRQEARAFTLIEMIGVLAVIAQYELYLAGNSRDANGVSAVDQSGQQSAFSLSTGLEF